MKKKNLILSALFAMSILAVLAFSGCEEPNPDYTVKYEITGPATVASFVMYRNETGNTDQIDNVNIPWSKTITIKGKDKFASCGAGFVYSNNETYNAKIYINGKQKATSSGIRTVTATCAVK